VKDRAFLRYGRIAISIALLYLVFAHVNLDELRNQASHTDIGGVGFALALFVTGGAFHGLRWKFTLDAMKHPRSLAYVLREVWIGYFFNQVLPTSMGGDGVRIYRLHKSDVPLHSSVDSVLIERLFALAACVLLSLPAVAYLWTAAPKELATLLVSAATGIATIAGVVFLTPLPGRVLPLPNPIRRSLTTIRLAFMDWTLTARSLLASAAMHGVTALMLAILASAIGVSGTWKVALMTPPIVLLMTIPVSFAGWGVREGVMVLILSVVGLSPTEALALGLLFGFVSLLTSLPGALFLALAPMVRRNP
jgi:glycosyltransferase 2 family protein